MEFSVSTIHKGHPGEVYTVQYVDFKFGKGSVQVLELGDAMR